MRHRKDLFISMKLLLVSDTEDKALWDYYSPSRVEGIDLIISCGDLDPEYLQFLVTMINRPLLYVRGNHDRYYDDNPPCGCTCIEDSIYDFRGLRIIGLGGSMRYKPGMDQYSENQMRGRIRRLAPQIRLRNGFDLLVTHAPAKGWGDLDDLPHRGFDCFNNLLENWCPAYMVHGHVHRAYGSFRRRRTHTSGTVIIIACQSHILEIGAESHPPQGKTGSFLYDLYMSVKKNS